MRVPWVRYIFEQAVQAYVAVEGVCHYPIADYRSWSDAKYRPFGLLGMQDVNGCRATYKLLVLEFKLLVLELRGQQIRLADPLGITTVAAHQFGILSPLAIRRQGAFL